MVARAQSTQGEARVRPFRYPGAWRVLTPPCRTACDAAAMHLIQFLLPVYDNDGQRILKARFDAVRNELAQRFGGVTAYVRAPAVGAWADEDGDLQRDDVILFEVMTPSLDRSCR